MSGLLGGLGFLGLCFLGLGFCGLELWDSDRS